MLITDIRNFFWGILVSFNLEGSFFFFSLLSLLFLKVFNNSKMNGVYESPKMEIIEICVENGYASSGGSTAEDYEDGGTIIL